MKNLLRSVPVVGMIAALSACAATKSPRLRPSIIPQLCDATREKISITTSSLADDLGGFNGLNPASVESYEEGSGSSIRAKMLEKIIKALQGTLHIKMYERDFGSIFRIHKITTRIP